MRKIKEFDEESLETIEDEVDRLTRMVGDLLLLAQAESGKIPLAHEVVELDTLMLEALNQMQVLARDRVKLSLGNIDQVLVCGDRDRLKQVLVNLIGNSINYTPQGGEIVGGVGKVSDRITDRGFLQRTCHTSLSVSTVERNRAPAKRKGRDLGWVYPLPIGLYATTEVGLRSTLLLAKAQLFASGYRLQKEIVRNYRAYLQNLYQRIENS
jgi:hypothetical protein